MFERNQVVRLVVTGNRCAVVKCEAASVPGGAIVTVRELHPVTGKPAGGKMRFTADVLVAE